MSLTISRPAIPVPLPLSRGGTEATDPAGARTKLQLGDLALLTAPGGTTTFLRADKTWAVPAGGGGGAPTDAEYITSITNATLSAERVLTDTATVTWDRTTAGQIKANAVGGGGGSGDVSSNTATAVDSELAVFSGTTGKLVKRGTGSGLAWIINGVLGVKTPVPTGALVGTTDAQTLTSKTITGASNTLSVREADLVLTDVTTRDVSISQHGFVPKAPGGTTAFLRGDATWAVPAGGGGGAPTDAEYITSIANATLSAERVLTDTATVTWDRATAGQIKANASGGGGGAPTDAEYITSTVNGTLSAERVLADSATITWDRSVAGQITANAIGGGGYTDEQAQDAIGAILLSTATIDLSYSDATPSLSAFVKDASITEAKLSLSDVTTKDASTTAHGLLRKLSGTPTQYLDGSGAWTTPAGGGTNYWSRTELLATDLTTGLVALWAMEEATGNRVDSIGTQHLVPQGTVAQLTNGTGKLGQALSMNGTGATFLSTADSANLSGGAGVSLTLGVWIYPTSSGATRGVLGKGNASIDATAEYFLTLDSGVLRFAVGNGSTSVSLNGPTLPLNQWSLVFAWYDAAAQRQYLQVDNGTPVSVANTVGTYNSTFSFEVGRYPNWAAAPCFSGRLDQPLVYRRVLSDAERTQWWNGGAGLALGGAGMPVGIITPATATDMLALTAQTQTPTGITDGTLRWSGADFEGRKSGAWVSMTGGGAGGGQPLDATLTALAGLATGADQLPYATGTDTFSQTTLTTFARTLLDDTTQAAMRTTLALTPGTDVQAQDAELQAIAGLVSAADRAPYFTGAGTAALATFTAAGRTLVGAADAAAQRTALALGTMAQQDANAVAITGGLIGGATTVSVAAPVVVSNHSLPSPTAPVVAGVHTTMTAGTDRWNVLADGTAANFFLGPVGFGGIVPVGIQTYVVFQKAAQYALMLRPSDNDTGPGQPIRFQNAAGGEIGLISTSGTGTAYNTTSDARLKHAITPLTGALDTVTALRPVAFRWNANDEVGHGFLAHELQREIPDAVTGEPDAVNADGSVRPQQVDHSRLVPWLTACCQELAARVASLEQQLGI